MTQISEARILILAADGFAQAELTVPCYELCCAGAGVESACRVTYHSCKIDTR